ncbi:TIGR03809 family protein [Bradyrhizobium lablabi]|uniref:TIGR03809 family protein n=1 Tax=Bradyrhizobium lablabi TaxID=722472 RepID=UPI001BAAFAB4|nr:TIGR03809 family protein [Bradyrhizobium lablabi]MBR0694671.1 TIGR03809 family protein [Bradyrhizobium lablabi]
MTHRTDAARGREIVARWCSLAEQRLEYLTELFETGRWRRYHSEQAFLENVREARAAVETWRQLLSREASLDNSPIDLSWLGRGRSSLPRRGALPARMPVRQPDPVVLAQSTMTAVAAALETASALLEETPQRVDTRPPEIPTLPVLDLASIQARYPLLRNTL